MKLIFTQVLLFTFLSTIYCQIDRSSADRILQKMLNQITAIKNISYKYRRELNYPSEGYFRETIADTYLDFTSDNQILGLRFQFSDADSLMIFNGSEIFYLDKKNKTIDVTNKPKRNYIDSVSFLYNSPVTLKNIIPKIIADKTIPRSLMETKINGKDFYVVEFVIDKFGFDLYGNFHSVKLERKLTYKITVDKNDFMPIEVLQQSGDTDFIKTNFTNFDYKPSEPTENSWYYSSYTKAYKFREQQKEELIKVGVIAPDFQLRMFPSDTHVSLSNFKGQVVLLNFWIYHCGACIASVPKLSALQTKYKDKNFKLITVNIYDSRNLIDQFIKTNKSEFPIAYNGETVAKQFGVFSYPTAILLDKEGKVIFSGTFDQTKIDELIAKNQ